MTFDPDIMISEPKCLLALIFDLHSFTPYQKHMIVNVYLAQCLHHSRLRPPRLVVSMLAVLQ